MSTFVYSQVKSDLQELNPLHLFVFSAVTLTNLFERGSCPNLFKVSLLSHFVDTTCIPL